MENYVTLKALSRELGLDRSNLRKFVLRHGFDFIRVRTPESRQQLTLALSLEDADAVKDLRTISGFFVPGDEAAILDNSKGHFYIIQLIPELAPNRVKLGFSSNVESRLASYRTSAPTALLAYYRPCKRAWEAAAIASITQSGCTPISNEVFDCENLDDLRARCAAFFDLMPE